MRTARIRTCAAGAALALALCAGSASAASDVVISQVYGGGGNSGSTYRQDFIELFNRGANPVDITGWSVQYASAGGSTWNNLTVLTGEGQPNASFILQPGQYFLIQEFQGGGGTADLPTPDAIGSINMSGSNGKVALVNTTTSLVSGCPAGAQIIDFVGFGVAATCWEGTGPTATLSNTTSAARKTHGCTDTDDNAADFTVGTLVLGGPRNSQTTLAPCDLLNLTASASPNAIYSGNATLLTATPSGGNGPGSYSVSVDLTVIDASLSATQQLFDNGTNGDATGGDGVFSYLLSLASVCNPSGGFGDKSLPFSVNDGSTTANMNATLTINDGNVLNPGITPPVGGTADDGMPSDATRCAGETVTFSAGAEGGNLSYQWKRGNPPGGVNLVDGPTGTGSTISGATTPTLTITNVSAADAAAGPYYCTITGGCAGTSIDQGPAGLVIGTAATALDKMVIIKEIWGASGNGGAFYKNDYVQLFNTSTTNAVDVSGWSIQWATSGTFQPIFDRPARVVVMPGGTVIQPGQYLLVKLFPGNAGPNELPTPNLDLSAGESININPNGGKIALLNISTPVSGLCPYGDTGTPNACNLVDFVGWDPAAGCAEGGNPAPNSNGGAVFRPDVCTGGNDNAADFDISNLAFPVASGTSGGATIVSQPSDANTCEGGEATFVVGSRGECRTIQWYDQNGALADGGDYTGTQTPVLTIANVDATKVANGPYHAIVSSPFGNATSDAKNIVINPANADDKQVVIAAVYGGGGNLNATYQNDFVELYNKGATSVSLEGWSVQYASSGGESWDPTQLTGSIAPGEYYLIQLAAGSGCAGTPCGAALPPAQVSDDTPMNASSGKVALVKTTAPLAGACPKDDCRMVDFLGYGSANCFEGLNPAPPPADTTQSVTRNPICNDSNQNSFDFVSQAVLPHGGGPSSVAADLDNDGDVDGNLAGAANDDLDLFVACVNGTHPAPYDPDNLPAGCSFPKDCAGRIQPDFDKNGVINLNDFAVYQRCYSGASPQTDPNCGG